MNMRTIAVACVSLGVVGPVSVAAAQSTPKHRLTGSYYWQQSKPPEQKPEPKPEPKAEAKPTAATLAGKWTANIESPNGAISSALDLKADPKDAKKVTGTITSPQGEAALEGEFAEGKLTFLITINANGTEMAITFVGTVQKDGSLAGTLNFAGQGEMAWTATKDKK